MITSVRLKMYGIRLSALAGTTWLSMGSARNLGHVELLSHMQFSGYMG